MQPVALTSTWSNSSIAYSGSYQTATSGWYQYGGLSGSEYQSIFNTLAGEGYRPTVVNVNEWYSTWYINAIFAPAEGAFSSSTGMTASQFNSTNSSLASQGYVIVDLYGYSDSSGNPYFAATWVQKTGNGQTAQIGIPASQYQSIFNSKANAGYYPNRISAYDNAGATDYAVLWEHAPTGGFYADNGASVSSIESLDSQVAGSGYHLKYVSALNDSFSGVFTK
jgi:hypothetical protein